MKILAFLLTLFAAFSSPQLDAKAQQIDDPLLQNVQYSRYSYVHKRSYSTRYGRSCYCYSVSSSAHVLNSFQIARRNSWNAAIAVRNNYARSRNTCPGSCQRPIAFGRVRNPGTIIRRQPGVAVRPPPISTGHAKCRRHFGSRSYATRYIGNGRWSCATRRIVRNPRYVPRGNSRFVGPRSCIYGIPC